MIWEIMRDTTFLPQKAEPATQANLPVARHPQPPKTKKL